MSAVHLAEQATLGGLLLEPACLDTIAGWLRVEDFEHPWHREVFSAIRERHIARNPIDPATIGQDLVERLGGRKADLARFFDLLRATPIQPAVRRYGSMVLETSLRRVVAQQGVLLQAAALSSSLSQTRDQISAAALFVDTILLGAEDRWAIAHGGERTDSLRIAAVGPANGGLDAALGADRLLRAHPSLDPATAKANERALVATLIARPQRIPAFATWLRAEALTDPAWRPVYAALVQLAELGEQVDVVTVLWEVRRAAARHGRGPGIDELLEASDSTVVGDPGRLGRTVAGDQLRRTADRGAQALRSAEANTGLDLADVIQTGYLITSALRETAIVLPQSDDQELDRPGAWMARPLEAVHPERAEMLGPVAG